MSALTVITQKVFPNDPSFTLEGSFTLRRGEDFDEETLRHLFHHFYTDGVKFLCDEFERNAKVSLAKPDLLWVNLSFLEQTQLPAVFRASRKTSPLLELGHDVTGIRHDFTLLVKPFIRNDQLVFQYRILKLDVAAEGDEPRQLSEEVGIPYSQLFEICLNGKELECRFETDMTLFAA